MVTLLIILGIIGGGLAGWAWVTKTFDDDIHE